MTNGQTFALEIQCLRKYYGKVRAVDGMDLQVPVGSCFGLLGPTAEHIRSAHDSKV
jgi:ABC-type multidrug transport system ATPase subunit